MNILILASRIEVSSGWGRYTLDLAESLQKNGHSVLVACGERNEKFNHIQQIPTLPSPLQLKKTHFLAFIYAWQLSRLLKKKQFRPDIIHCVVEPYAPIASYTARSVRSPFIVTCHGSFAVNMFDHRCIGTIQKKALQRAATVVCVSRYTKTRLLAHMSELSPLVIHNGINLTRFGNTEPVRRKEALILSVGALKERKGFDLVLIALPHVVQKIPTARYVIIGDQHDAKYVAYLKDLVSQYGLDGRVQLLGQVSEEALQSYYRKAKVFVLTPRSTPTSFEGFGLVYLEAGAYGLPSIGSYGNGGEEAIINGETGLLVHIDNEDELVENIVKILSLEDDAYENMSANARMRTQNLSWDAVMREYLDVYKSVL